MRTEILLLLAAALVFSAGSAAAQSTWVVDQGGAGDFTTIQACIGAAAPGDTCQVNAGTYERSLIIGKSITLLSTEGPQETIIKSGPPFLFYWLVGAVTVYDYWGSTVGPVTIDGFTLTGAVAVAGGGLFIDRGTVRVRNCVIRNNSSGLYGNLPYTGKGGGGIFALRSSLTVEDSVISDNSSYATMFHAQRGGAIHAEETSLTVTNCLIEGNRASDGGGAVYLNSSQGAVFTNCTIADNEDDAGTGGILAAGTASFHVTNSVLWNQAAELSGTATASYSNVEGGFTGTGNMDADPLFVGAGDYRLSPNSPCIDAGTNGAIFLPALDLDGNNRVLDGNCDFGRIVDMGAYEFVADCSWPVASTAVVGKLGVTDSRPSHLVNGLLPLLVPFVGILLWKGFRRRCCRD